MAQSAIVQTNNRTLENPMKRTGDVMAISFFVALALAIGVGINVFLNYADQHWGRMAVALFGLKYCLLGIASILGLNALTWVGLEFRKFRLQRRHNSQRIEAKKVLPIGRYRSAVVEATDLDDQELKRVRAIPPGELPEPLRKFRETSDELIETDNTLKNFLR